MSAGGPSLKRLPPGGGGKLFAAVLLVLGAIAIVIYAIATAGDAVSQSAEITANVFAGLFALGMLVFAYVLVRKVFPPSAKHLRVTVSADDVRRGGTIDVRLELLDAGDTDEDIQLGLVCTEYYDFEKTTYSSNGSRRSRDTADAIAYEDWRAASHTQSVQNVRFDVPADAPYTFRGTCLSFEWRVSARDPKPGFDRSTNVPVKVRP